MDDQQSPVPCLDRHHLKQLTLIIRPEEHQARVAKYRALWGGLGENDPGALNDVSTASAADAMSRRRPRVPDLHSAILSDRIDEEVSGAKRTETSPWSQ